MKNSKKGDEKMEHKDLWLVIGLTVLLAATVTLSTVSLANGTLTGDATKTLNLSRKDSSNSTGYNFYNSNLTISNSSVKVSNSNLTVSNSSVIITNSNVTLQLNGKRIKGYICSDINGNIYINRTGC